MQVRQHDHTGLHIDIQDTSERNESNLNEDAKQFFRLFQESTFEGSRAAARKMKKIAKRQNKHNQKFLLLHSLKFLARSNSEMLSWPNSPLLVLLQYVDPNMVFLGDEDLPLEEGDTRETLLHYSADLADPSDYSTHENQLILAKQLIENGANVNALSMVDMTPLHRACYAGMVTNLDFIQLLLKKDADPNAQDHLGSTPLMYTTPYAPGAAKFLLNWPTTDANITTPYGTSFVDRVRRTITDISSLRPDNLQNQFLLQQWREIEEMLVERGAADTRITAVE
jgi:hypothetical protein